MVERRKARVPRHGTQGRLASAPARSVIACPPDAAASGRLSALRPPLIGVAEIGKDPGATRRGNEIVRLFRWVELLRDPTPCGIRDRWVSRRARPNRKKYGKRETGDAFWRNEPNEEKRSDYRMLGSDCWP